MVIVAGDQGITMGDGVAGISGESWFWWSYYWQWWRVVMIVINDSSDK